ncbi:MAG: VWA domain-containing protein [Lamprobacter sp.]|uniref:vWA domain-containing protein n=1 Tax=Lamprobacter sp. TaxID=3100796 RepID=UPI002B257C9A|nr:VWA domain-containing protein [Lamprobacter sp.]MEA3641622.1 VWA domain-containing protein [Lamprobacter sp.]
MAGLIPGLEINLAWPWLLLALPLPWLVRLGLPRAEAAAPSALRVPFYRLLSRGQDHALAVPRRWTLLLALLAWLLLVLAAARPQWLGEPVALPMAGRDLMLAVDISGSMTEEDMVIGGQWVDRLMAVKAVAGDFIERREGDRVGLILFGQQAYMQTPLTFDRATARTLLFESAVGLAGRETAIGDAIGLAVKRLRDQPTEERVLVLLTDGANTAGSIAPLKAAELAEEAGVRIYSIGIGSDPRAGFGAFGLSMGRNPIDEATLSAIAERTGGRYFRARDVRELQGIYAVLDELEPVESDQQRFRPVGELFVWPLGAALLLTALLAIGPVGLIEAIQQALTRRQG